MVKIKKINVTHLIISAHRDQKNKYKIKCEITNKFKKIGVAFFRETIFFDRGLVCRIEFNFTVSFPT